MGKEKCNPNSLDISKATQNSDRFRRPQHMVIPTNQLRPNQPRSKVLNCEQTAVCDITINNPLREAFRVVIHPMAEVRFIESIRNRTHVNVDAIQPSSIWLMSKSKRNRVSFLCLPGGIENGLFNFVAIKN